MVYCFIFVLGIPIPWKIVFMLNYAPADWSKFSVLQPNDYYKISWGPSQLKMSFYWCKDFYYKDVMEIPYLYTGLILGLCPANERRRYKVTSSLICWAQT